jgi:hypothetical protein
MTAPEKRELVAVFDTQQETEAMVIQGLLESAGIESMLRTLDSPQDVLPGVGGVQVRVAPDDAAEAKRVIDEYRNNPEPEIEIEDSPA